MGIFICGGTMTDLGASFSPAAINDNGVIVGTSTTEAGAVIFSNGVLQNLNNPIPPGSGIVLNQATAINDNGQIVAETNNRPVLLTPN